MEGSDKMEEKSGKMIYRRFVPIGTKEILNKFETLIAEKHLNRDDLSLILKAIRLNPDIS